MLRARVRPVQGGRRRRRQPVAIHAVALPEATPSVCCRDDISALPRLFPVMLRVAAIARACRERAPAVSEPFLLRRLAFAVLRELLARIARRHRLVVIVVDDLQWADVDGALLLEELLRPPDAPALLALMSFRSEEIADNGFLRKLVERGDADGWTHLCLEPLPDAEADQLVSALLPTDSGITDGQRARITREAGGSPFLLEQLARCAELNPGTSAGEPTFGRNVQPPARHALVRRAAFSRDAGHLRPTDGAGGHLRRVRNRA